MSLRRKRKDGFLADYTLEQDYLQKPNVSQGRPGVFGGLTSDGTPVLVKEWARNSGAHDEDLEPIWRHEMRQLHRLAGYPGAVESIAQLYDAGHDAKGFYLVIAPGQRQPLQTFLDRPGNDHWLRQPRVPANRALIWSNLRRLALGLEALHAQGLLHRNLDAWSVLTAGVSEPDFQLTGFEWSMRITDRTSRHTPRTSVNSSDSFVKDWTLFGFLAAELLGVKRERLVDASIAPSDIADYVGVEEARLLRGLLQMMPLTPLNGERVASTIDSVLRGLAAEVASRQAKYHLVVRLGMNSQLTDKIREASDQSIEADDIAEQLKFIESDLGEAPLVIAHRLKDAQNYRLLLRGRSLYYRLQEFRATNATTSTWGFAYTEAVDYAPAPAGIVGNLPLTPESIEVLPLREASSKYARMRGKLSSWEEIRRQFEQEQARTSNEDRVFLVPARIGPTHPSRSRQCALPQNAQTMRHLILRPGPELVLRDFRPEPDELGPRPKERKVTDRAHEFLFEAITLHPQATLADVFALMEASPLLKRIYRPSFVGELCAEASKGPSHGEQQPGHDRIEYLELYAQWGLDTRTQTYSGTTRLRLHGAGPVLQEDHPKEHKRKGERIEWAVSLTPLRSLLALPVRVNQCVRITEDDQAAQAWMQEIGRAQVEDVTLGQVIEGLMWELSFHGGPAEQEAVAEDLRQRVAEVHDGKVEMVSSDEVFERLGLPGCEDLFDEFGGHKPREVDQALRDIGDTENAADWIARKFECRVVVKPEFRHLNGREFRRSRQDLRR